MPQTRWLADQLLSYRSGWVPHRGDCAVGRFQGQCRRGRASSRAEERAGDEPTLKLHESQGLLPYLPLSLDEQFIYWLDTSTGFIVRIRK